MLSAASGLHVHVFLQGRLLRLLNPVVGPSAGAGFVCRNPDDAMGPWINDAICGSAPAATGGRHGQKTWPFVVGTKNRFFRFLKAQSTKNIFLFLFRTIFFFYSPSFQESHLLSYLLRSSESGWMQCFNAAVTKIWWVDRRTRNSVSRDYQLPKM